MKTRLIVATIMAGSVAVAAAQAGFGIGVRVMQSLFLPSVAIGFATAATLVCGVLFGMLPALRTAAGYSKSMK